MNLNIRSIATEHRWLIVLCLLFLLFGIFRLNDLSLYTDSTRYVIWGTSFAQLNGLVDDTQPVPERYIVNAPLYAVLLSPALVLFPFSLTAAKVWTLLWTVAFLIAFYAFLARLVGKKLATVGLLPLVFNPLLLLISTEVLTEASFLTLTFVSLLMLEVVENPDLPWKRAFLVLLAILSTIVLLREVAIALVAVMILYFFARKDLERAVLIIVGALVFFGAWLFRNLVLVGTPPGSQATNLSFLFEHFVTSPSAPIVQEFALRVANNVSGYVLHAAGMLFYPIPDVLMVEPSGLFRAYYKVLIIAKYIVPVLLLPLLALGIWRDLKEHVTGFVRIAFLIAYLCIILVYPLHDVRFLLPLLPFYIFYVVLTIRWLRITWFATAHLMPKAVAILLLSLVAVPNGICLYEILQTNIRYTSDPLKFYEHLRSVGLVKNMFTKPWKLMGTAIEEKTPNNVVIASALKEVSIFIGERKLLELNNGVPVTTFDHYVRDFAVDYLLSTSSWDDFRSYEFQMAESKRFWFEPVTQVAGMQLLKVHPTHTTPKQEWLPTKRMQVDTVTANGLLRKARAEILQGQYPQAIASLRRAQELAPGQAMIAYQLTVALAMSGRLEEASSQLQRLFSFAQSSTYTPVATKHLAVSQSQARAEQSSNPLQRSLTLFDVASFYWNYGYYNQAYAIMRQSLKNDSTYFTGLLWGWHYAMQLADTSQAKIYLRQLEGIDRSNPVVRGFHTMSLLADSLRRTSSPARRCKLRLALARSYEAVDLPEEAIDEAQRALRDNPSSVEAWLFQGQVFDRRKAERAARQAYQQVLRLDPANALAVSRLRQK